MPLRGLLQVLRRARQTTRGARVLPKFLKMFSPIPFLRKVALAEAVSYLLLLGFAMPLKYLAGQPLGVKIIGMVHGVLFVIFGLALLRVLLAARWPFSRCVLIFMASFVPLVPFFMDRRLAEWERNEA